MAAAAAAAAGKLRAMFGALRGAAAAAAAAHGAANHADGGWRAGHSGVDRPGPAFLHSSECADAGCCFDLCHSAARCASWGWFEGTCSLRETVPAQRSVVGAVRRPALKFGTPTPYDL
eukprot:SAG31_NODE_4075_length_3612_cov_2.080843_1_plen_118_part_00